jgi:hypothetical protein
MSSDSDNETTPLLRDIAYSLFRGNGGDSDKDDTSLIIEPDKETAEGAYAPTPSVVMALSNHPNVIQTHCLFRRPESTRVDSIICEPYVEFLHYGSLLHVLPHLVGAADWDMESRCLFAWSIAFQTMVGLYYLWKMHDHIHIDISTTCILIRGDGTVKITNWANDTRFRGDTSQPGLRYRMQVCLKQLAVVIWRVVYDTYPCQLEIQEFVTQTEDRPSQLFSEHKSLRHFMYILLRNEWSSRVPFEEAIGELFTARLRCPVMTNCWLGTYAGNIKRAADFADSHRPMDRIFKRNVLTDAADAELRRWRTAISNPDVENRSLTLYTFHTSHHRLITFERLEAYRVLTIHEVPKW